MSKRKKKKIILQDKFLRIAGSINFYWVNLACDEIPMFSKISFPEFAQNSENRVNL